MEGDASAFVQTMERNILEQLARGDGAGRFRSGEILAGTLRGGAQTLRQDRNRQCDAGAHAYTDCAIDQACRAVGEITKNAPKN